MTTLLGISVGSLSATANGVGYDRESPSDYSIEAHENAVRTAIGDATFSFGSNRRYYHDIQDAFPPDGDGTTGRLNRDYLADRLPVMSYKGGALSWDQISAGSGDAALTTLGNAIKTWQLAHEGLRKWGATFAWYFHHEPNSSVDEGGGGATTYAQSGAQWRSAVEHIIELWKGLGVLMWDGTWENGVLTTTQEGLMLGALNLTWGSSMNSVPTDWWPSSWTWGNDNVVAPAADAYDRRPGNTTPDGTWDGLPNGFNWGSNAFKNWTDAKKITQAALGRPLLPFILEMNCEERTSYSSQSAAWMSNGGTDPATKAKAYANFADWVETSWPELFCVNFWDAVGSFDFRIDSSTAAWNAWLTMVQHPQWMLAADPLTLPSDLNVTSDTTISGSVAYDNVYVSPGATLTFDPAHNTVLTVNCNQVDTGMFHVYGTLKMHPDSSHDHSIIFSGINESLYVGGAQMFSSSAAITAMATDMGMSVTWPIPATEVGLFILNDGKLDVVGTTKTSWNRTGTDATWLSTDEYIKAPWGSTAGLVNVNMTSWTYGTAPLAEIGPNGVTYTQEIVNLTRNVHIQGTTTGYAHIYILSTQPQVVKYAELRYMGPQQNSNNAILGRYALHYHHMGDFSIGSEDVGIVVRQTHNRAFVPHDSNGLHFNDCITYGCLDESFWYDDESGGVGAPTINAPGDLTYEHCGVFQMGPGHKFNMSGFKLGAVRVNDGNEIFNCVVTGGSTKADAGGYFWTSDANGAEFNVWDFHDNVAHNYGRVQGGVFTGSQGVRVWQNDTSPHHLERLVMFHVSTTLNESAGLTHGAYHNQYHYTDCVFWDCTVAWGATSTGTSGAVDDTNQRWTNCYFYRTANGFHKLTPVCPVILLDCTWSSNFYISDTVSGQWMWVINSNLEPANVITVPTVDGAGNPTVGYYPDTWIGQVDGESAPSRYFFQRSDGTAFRLNQNNQAATEFLTIAPFYLYVTTPSLANPVVGTAYSQNLSAQLGTSPYTWSLKSGSLPAGLTLSSAGVISGTPTTTGVVSFTVRVTDAGGMENRKAYSVTVQGSAALSISTSSLPNASTGTSYSQTLVAAGGSGGYVWSLVSGTLPAGIGLNAAGVISGTPTTAGTSNFTVRVTDSSLATITRAFVITVTTLSPVITTTSPLPTGEVGVVYSLQLVATGGTAPLTWSLVAGTLPSGLSLNSTTGVISGTPTAPGTPTPTFRCTDSASHSIDKTLALTVVSAVVFLTAIPRSGAVGRPYTYTFTAENGIPPYTFLMEEEAKLPQGLTLATTGVLSGTPVVAGTYPIGVRVIDSAFVQTAVHTSILIRQGPQRTKRGLHLRGPRQADSVQ